MAVNYYRCGKTALCNCAVVLSFRQDRMNSAYIDNCQPSFMATENNLFNKTACDESPLHLSSIDQAFDEPFWKNISYNFWLGCAKYGANTYFVNARFTIINFIF